VYSLQTEEDVFEDYRLVEGYFHSAQGLIAYFRDALLAQVPFISDYSIQELSRLTNVDEEECKFLMKLKDYLQDNSRSPRGVTLFFFSILDIRRFPRAYY